MKNSKKKDFRQTQKKQIDEMIGNSMGNFGSMIILFKANGRFEMFRGNEDQKILSVLRRMDKKEKDKTEIAIFERPEGDYRRFLLYPDKHFQDIPQKKIYSLEANIQLLELAGCQVISAEQYDLRGYKIETYSTGEKGKVQERKLTAYGIEYQIEKTDGSIFTAYDSDLEVI